MLGTAYARSMRRLPVPFVLSTAAVVWSAALVAVAYLAPAYSVESETGSCTAAGHCTSQTAHTTATLVEMNGQGVVAVIGVIIVIAVLGWLVGWAAAIAVTGFSLVSFGIYTVPMAIMMIAAAVMTPGRGAGSST